MNIDSHVKFPLIFSLDLLFRDAWWSAILAYPVVARRSVAGITATIQTRRAGCEDDILLQTDVKPLLHMLLSKGA
jgi:hypothetical protein